MIFNAISKRVAKTSVALAIGVSVWATTSQAATYSVGGVDYDVTTFFGSYSANIPLLESQVWWGDSALAKQFSDQVRHDLGTQSSNSDFGAFFATELPVPDVLLVTTWDTFFGPDNGISGEYGRNLPTSGLFAIARIIPAVPLPAGGLLLLSGLAAAVGLSRRKKRTA